MSKEIWHLGIDGEKTGPHTWEEIETRRRNGEIPDSALVWMEDLPDWSPIGEIEKSHGTSTPDDWVTCAISGRRASPTEMLQYGERWVLPEHKDEFVQSLQEGGMPRNVTANHGIYHYKDPSRLGAVSRWLIVLVTVSSLLYSVITLVFFPELLSAQQPQQQPFSSPAYTFSMGFSCFSSLIYIAAIVYFCCWTYRVAANAIVFSGSTPRFSPGWCVGWFFIPLANLVMPYLCMADVAKSTLHPDQGIHAPTPRVVVIWWASWIAMNLSGFVVGFFGALGHPEIVKFSYVATLPLSALGGWAAWRLIADLTEAQSPARISMG